MKIYLNVLMCASIATISCDNKDDSTPTTGRDTSINVVGMNFTKSTSNFETSYSSLTSSLEANPNIKIVAEVNHQENAISANLELNPTRIVFFGNPNLGTPLMQKNQLIGLDLPQKILVYQNDKDEVILSYNNTEYLSERHNVTEVNTLPMISGALQNLSTNASGGELTEAQSNTVDLNEGIITKTSNQNFEDTYNSLQTAIANNPNLRIVAEVNHQANAESVTLELNPTRLIVFGNPNLGTPLMQNAQTTALDLPQKILVWEDDAKVVHVSYNNPAYLAKRHQITENTMVLETITNALTNLSNVAVGQ